MSNVNSSPTKHACVARLRNGLQKPGPPSWPRRKRLRRAALDRIEAAESLEASFADVEAALADYLSSSDVLGDRGRPAAWWLQHRLNSLFPFDFPRSPRRMGEPLAEYERERLADHITEEEAQ